jgi:hypothetical protein
MENSGAVVDHAKAKKDLKNQLAQWKAAFRRKNGREHNKDGSDFDRSYKDLRDLYYYHSEQAKLVAATPTPKPTKKKQVLPEPSVGEAVVSSSPSTSHASPSSYATLSPRSPPAADRQRPAPARHRRGSLANTPLSLPTKASTPGLQGQMAGRRPSELRDLVYEEEEEGGDLIHPEHLSGGGEGSAGLQGQMAGRRPQEQALHEPHRGSALDGVGGGAIDQRAAEVTNSRTLSSIERELIVTEAAGTQETGAGSAHNYQPGLGDANGSGVPPPTIENWLDTIREGLGASCGPAFHAHGVEEVRQLVSSEDKFHLIVAQIENKKARRAVRSAFRSHLEQMKKADEEGGGGDGEAARVAASALPAGWVAVPSKSRPGEVAYKHPETGARSPKMPTVRNQQAIIDKHQLNVYLAKREKRARE